MSKIQFPKKPRADRQQLWTTKDGEKVFIGRNYALQNQIDESKKKTQERSCFSACQTCGHCKASRRSCSADYSFDTNTGKRVHCAGCERFGFCDCANGFLRNAHGEAEPFTPDHQKLLKDTGGKPLI